MEGSTWERALRSAWQSSPTVESFLGSLSVGCVDVQTEWDSFQDVLMEVATSALHTLHVDASVHPEARASCIQMAQQNLNKGSVAQHLFVSSAQAGVRHEAGFLAVRRMRRRLARLYEYRRLLLRAEGLTAQRQHEKLSLAKSLRRHFGADLGLAAVCRHIGQLAAVLRRLDKDLHQERLCSWRDSLTQSDAAVGRWIKSKTNPVGVALADMQGHVAASDADAADCIHRFWSDFWRDSAARLPSRQQRVENLLANVPPHEAIGWPHPSGQDLRSVAQRPSASLKPDGWHALEIKAFQVDAFDVFSQLFGHWICCGAVPQQV